MWRIRWSSVLLLGLGPSTSAVGLRASLAEEAGINVALWRARSGR